MSKKSITVSSAVTIGTQSPRLEISKIGIVARDYNTREDFSESIYDVLQYLDKEGCDSAVFSLYTLLTKNSLNLDKLHFAHLRTIFVEEFEEKVGKRQPVSYNVYHSDNGIDWGTHQFTQKFASLSGVDPKHLKIFVNEEIPNNRIMGNTIVLLCGETNVVKINRKDFPEITGGVVKDIYGILGKIPNTVNIILNPIHDRMTRYEMKNKRAFLSQNSRIVISVWNKGKKFKGGRTDNTTPAYTIFFDGKEKTIPKSLYKSTTDTTIEIGICETNRLCV